MMKTNLLTKILVAVFLSVATIAVSPLPVFASGKLFLDPSSKYVNKNDEFEIKVTIDSENNKIFGMDAVINYANKDLEIKSVSNGGFFTDLNSAIGDDKIEIHGLFSNLYETKSGIGTVATIKIVAKSEAGIAELSFACGGTNETQILNEGGNNILACDSLNNSNIFFGQTQSTTIPTPTSKATTKTSAKPTVKPSPSPIIVTLSSYPPSPSPSESPVVGTNIGDSNLISALPLPVILGIAVLGILLLAIIITLIASSRRRQEMEKVILPTSPTLPPIPQDGQSNPPLGS